MIRRLVCLLALALLAAEVASGGEASTAPVVSLSDGRDLLASSVEAIDFAEESVFVAVYKFDEPTLAKALVSARKRGVDVRLLVDDAELEKRFFRPLLESGAKVRRWRARHGKLHVKFALIDGKEVHTGSYNWTKSAVATNVELIVRFEDPDTVKRFGEMFESLWKKGKKL